MRNPFQPMYSTQQLGTFSIPVPPTNTVNQGAVGWTETEIVVPDSSYIRIRVYGEISVGTNPEYAARYPDHGTPPLSGTSVPPWGNIYSNLAVGVYVSGQTATFHADMRDGVSMEALIWVPVGGEVKVRRSGIAGSTTCVCDGESITYGHYSLQGSQFIEVTEVDVPARLHASRTRIEPNDTVRFTAQVDGAVESPKIIFVAGDTLAKPANVVPRGGYYALTAVMPISQSGRAYFVANVDHLKVVVPSEVVWVRQPSQTFPSAELTADRYHVAPGEEVTFTAGLSNGAAAGPHNLQIQSWTWLDSNGVQTTVCQDNQYVCALGVTEAGTMQLQAKAYGNVGLNGQGIAVVGSSTWFAAQPATIGVRMYRLVDATYGPAATWSMIGRQKDEAQRVWMGTCNIRLEFFPDEDKPNPYEDNYGVVRNGFNILVRDASGAITPEANNMAGSFRVWGDPATNYQSIVVRSAMRDLGGGNVQTVNGIGPTPGNTSWLSGVLLYEGEKTLAHELGHNMGLGEGAAGTTNLMSTLENGTDLSFAQCDTARGRALILPGQP